MSSDKINDVIINIFSHVSSKCEMKNLKCLNVHFISVINESERKNCGIFAGDNI